MADTTSFQNNPSLWVSNGIIYVAWHDKRAGDWGIYFSKSLDSGRTFTPNVKVDHDPPENGIVQACPSLVTDQKGIIYVGYNDGRPPPVGGTYFTYSIDGGQTFLPEIQAHVDSTIIFQDSTYFIGSGAISLAVNDSGTVFNIFTSNRFDPVFSERYDVFAATGRYNVTGISDDLPTLPYSFYLAQNYPSPFNTETHISFSLTPKESNQFVSLKIYNLLGQLVRTLVAGRLASTSRGIHRFSWNGEDDAGRKLASGIYFYLLQAGDRYQAKKMFLLKQPKYNLQ